MMYLYVPTTTVEEKPMKTDLSETSFLVKILTVCSVALPYLGSSVFFFKYMISLCGAESLVLSGIAWLLGSAFAYCSIRYVMAEISFHDSDKGILLFLICLLWTVLWVVETAFRAVIVGTVVTCDSTSFALLLAWVVGGVVGLLLTEAIVYMLQDNS